MAGGSHHKIGLQYWKPPKGLVNETDSNGLPFTRRGTSYVQEQLAFCLASPWPGYTEAQQAACVFGLAANLAYFSREQLPNFTLGLATASTTPKHPQVPALTPRLHEKFPLCTHPSIRAGYGPCYRHFEPTRHLATQGSERRLQLVPDA